MEDLKGAESVLTQNPPGNSVIHLRKAFFCEGFVKLKTAPVLRHGKETSQYIWPMRLY